MIDLQAPVVLHGQPRTFEAYCETIHAENQGATDWLTRPDASWTVPESLRHKVADDGRLLPYPGDTVVLPLDRAGIATCRRLQKHLRAHIPEMLAAPLDPATFHVTLHDLSHGPQAAHLEENAARCRERFAHLARALDLSPQLALVQLVPTCVYPSVNVSMVLGLVPANDRDFRTIMNAYALFDDVVRLPYWLRLHVTLDYLLPRPLDPAKLHAALPTPPSAPLILDMRQLAYQHFRDMNTYATEFIVADTAHRD